MKGQEAVASCLKKASVESRVRTRSWSLQRGSTICVMRYQIRIHCGELDRHWCAKGITPICLCHRESVGNARMSFKLDPCYDDQ